jgi:anti-sigma B factor antagonist
MTPIDDNVGMHRMLSFRTSQSAGTTVVAVSGELDLYTAPRLREELLVALSEPLAGLIVDLSGLAFMDSTGLGLLIGAHRRATASGAALRVVCDHPVIVRILHVSGLDQVLAVDPTLEAALEATGQRVR